MTKKNLHPETLLAHYAEERLEHKGAVVPPLYQNSLFVFEDWDAIDEAFDDRYEHAIYSRGTNPTVRLVERKLAALAGAEAARLFGSGMAAVSAAVLHYVDAGDHVVAVKNVYGPTNNLLNRYLRRKMNLETTFVSGESIEEIEQALRPNTRLLYLESPSSAVFSLQDLAKTTALARSRGVATVIDNSWATPIFQKPLALGVDLEIHSASKYLGGHSDLIAGALIGDEKTIREIAVNEAELLGGKMAPFEAWLLLRSLRTLPIRMRQHQENALAVAQFLEGRPEVKQVRFPGLESHPQHALALRQMSGFSGLMSFELATSEIERIKAFVNALDLFQLGVSWGGHESLVYAPAISYLKELPPDQFAALGISAGDIRISVGLEAAEDLTADLEQALRAVEA
ncbi:MAG: aminotransferase class I/II-fold pyridoxal phosphate-dependent enzyme [Bryobacterales bacterium]|nr:aminotransferase class I/II-fold pyridoxal phosphate-dependent enzyme [Acidobacteriota bacterium]MCB9385911.1 aminotransferase class I/II-fold pyridoxal phosphate-dependent enzyme [Bryobacterales bacterium]